MWTLMQSDMCNRNQDLITSVPIRSNSGKTFHTLTYLEPLAVRVGANSRCTHLPHTGAAAYISLKKRIINDNINISAKNNTYTVHLI